MSLLTRFHRVKLSYNCRSQNFYLISPAKIFYIRLYDFSYQSIAADTGSVDTGGSSRVRTLRFCPTIQGAGKQVLPVFQPPILHFQGKKDKWQVADEVFLTQLARARSAGCRRKRSAEDRQKGQTHNDTR